MKAVNNVNIIIGEKLLGIEVYKQEEIDNLMIKLDGTDNKSNLGANAILGVSMAVARCAANYNKQELYEYLKEFSNYKMPIPMMNILNGGAHANFSIDFQEVMIMPLGAPSLKESLRYGSEIFHTLRKILIENGYSIGVGDEGGYAPNLSSNEEALQIVCEAIEKAGYKKGKDVCIALDVAASEFYDENTKTYSLKKDKKTLSFKELVDQYYLPLIEKYPIVSIEDGLAEDDFDGWKYMTDKIGDKIQLVGDDLFVTNEKRLRHGIENKYANAILIKVNQIGTLTETFNTIKLARENGYKYIISHRSGESEDTTIADISVACNSGQIKTGSLSRTDRIAKYNQLLRIEEKSTINKRKT